MVKYKRKKIKKLLDTKFHSKPAYDEKYIKAKVKTFNAMVNTVFWNDKIPKENVHYTWIAAISIDSVMKIDKKNYPQAYLKECKYEIKWKKMTKFISAGLDFDGSNDFNDSDDSNSK